MRLQCRAAPCTPGGDFRAAGGSVANGISRWDGNRWSALASGSGIGGGGGVRNPPVRALAVAGTNVYAGGSFTTAGSAEAYGVAKWNGSHWSALGLGVEFGDTFAPNGSALAVSGSNLYAAGRFYAALNNGGEVVAVLNIAKWDGNRWSALGSGLDGFTRALAVSGSDLYVGGSFATAGGKASSHIARAYLLDLPALSVLRSGTEVNVSWPSADTAGFALEQAGSLAAPTTWITNLPASPMMAPTN